MVFRGNRSSRHSTGTDDRDVGGATSGARGSAERGQVIVIFAGGIVLFVLLLAVVLDVSWYWANTLRVQRAADAAALAGAVYLPNDTTTAYSRARAEATKNGYTSGSNATVTPIQDAANNRQLNVTISANVGTFFMRVVGIRSITATRASKAEYVLPVPMGSPQNYYGVGLLMMPAVTHPDTGYRTGTPTGSGSQWTSSLNANAMQDSNYARSARADASTPTRRQQQWDSFFPSSGTGSIPTPVTGGALTIDRITVRTRAFINWGTGNTSSCQLQAQLSYDGGTSWTTAVTLATPLPTTRPANDTYQTFVPTTSPTATWGRTWTRAELTGSTFHVRLSIVRGTPTTNCNGDRQIAVDTLEVVVESTLTGAPAPTDVHAPDGTLLVPQKFWGAMQSQGAPSKQGDAYMTGYAIRKGSANAIYDPLEYYSYGVDINGSGGQVWIFDPGFCDTTPFNTVGDPANHPEANINQGTGESWTRGNSGGEEFGPTPARPVSAQFNLWDTRDTPYDYGDDTLVATSSNSFRRLNLTDLSLDGDTGANYGNPTDCGSVAWHNEWWRLAQNLAPGTYRLQTTSRIYSAAIGSHPADAVLDGSDDQTDSAGLNAFAIWTTNSGTAPRVYGLGAMEAYFPLPGDQPSVFYLAQIDERYAGKWMDIDLWDPGDTGTLSADLSFLAPNGGSGTVTSFYYNHSAGTVKPTNFACGPSTSSLVSSITTSTGSGGIYNGQWLRICIKLDDAYSAPIDPASGEAGWWKIRYAMTGSGASTDLTTWEVTIRGNPVHLKVP